MIHPYNLIDKFLHIKWDEFLNLSIIFLIYLYEFKWVHYDNLT